MTARSVPAAPLLAGLFLAAATLLCSLAPAQAQTTMTAREALYSDYYRAVAAYERCRKGKLTKEGHAAIARYVERQGASEIGTKRLILIQQAKRDIREAGCDSPLATSALVRFDAELQPQLP
ncbi:MAG: hypothetical protein WD100_05385 [Tistlia sp.]|uniref:hypothetical protein n=1 Tax=Tistlia sp. TaxID=3057121 RepID=UPI0034A43902